MKRFSSGQKVFNVSSLSSINVIGIGSSAGSFGKRCLHPGSQSILRLKMDTTPKIFNNAYRNLTDYRSLHFQARFRIKSDLALKVVRLMFQIDGMGTVLALNPAQLVIYQGLQSELNDLFRELRQLMSIDGDI